MSNVTEIKSLRVKHLRSFCKKWQLDERLINPRFSITVFESDKIYECRWCEEYGGVTGKLYFPFRIIL